jgi:quercetin dioxygenase-like cupin family protein
MSKVHRFTGEENNLNWQGAEQIDIGDPDLKGLTGIRMISDPDGTPNFRFRYFRVEPGQHTFLHRHAHDHGIMILHGQATVLLGDKEYTVGPRDIVYISPHDLHQLRASGDEPLGFLCVIDPKAVGPEY